MKIISTRAHGFLDYIVGAFMTASPWILNIYHGQAESLVLIILGLAAIVYSLFTDYEMGFFKKIPMAAHLTMDLISGLFLAASPWVLGFANYVWAPHVIIGAMEVAVVLMTKPKLTRPSRTATVR